MGRITHTHGDHQKDKVIGSAISKIPSHMTYNSLPVNMTKNQNHKCLFPLPPQKWIPIWG